MRAKITLMRILWRALAGGSGPACELLGMWERALPANSLLVGAGLPANNDEELRAQARSHNSMWWALAGGGGPCPRMI
ncbi:MAG: hypothetical protein CVV15_09750 [Gammaproteobacteria bacterium HGW-Gammaproteobacteria-5]|nr:MAG: hypothetical protein CVV15_09750 [Gammaproteobacteria bacterium HGW-Gammaproteobacteria-5]